MNNASEDEHRDELELIDSKNMARVLEGFVKALALQQTRSKSFEENLT